MVIPAQQLTGLLLDSDWLVTAIIPPKLGGSGGNFSFGYLVENTHDGRQGFLKALDFSKALRSNDPAQALEQMTGAFNYERRLLELARRRRMSKVASSIESGSVVVDPSSPIGRVQYLIFDRADDDVRGYQAKVAFDVAWILRCLHQITVGVNQLNKAGIAHQDIKPSNILVFRRGSKIADLGRAVLKEGGTPYDVLLIAGDPAYAPLELIYGYRAADWSKHRIGCDLYQLGSMFVFLTTGLSINALMATQLPRTLHPMAWAGTFDDALPYLFDAFSRVITEFRLRLPEEIRDELSDIVIQLCNPNPIERGHPSNKKGLSDPYSLERYVSKLDHMARKAEHGLVTRFL